MDVGALAGAVEDHDHFGRSVDGGDRVWCHRRELGSFTDLDDHLAIAEQQPNPPLDHDEPVVTGMHLLRRNPRRRLEAHLHRQRASRRSTQHPRGDAVGHRRRRRADHDVVVVAHVEQRIEIDVQRASERYEHIETDRPFPGLDPTDRRCAEVRPIGDIVERETEGAAKTAQTCAHHLLDVLHHVPPRCVLRISQGVLP
jgi:hypothetical protein